MTPATPALNSPLNAGEGWWRLAFRLQGSVLPIVLPRMSLFGGLGLLVSLAHYYHLPVYVEALGDLSNNVACNLVLGLLLVFRTNTAYDRFWEGRKAWGELVVNIRNLARELRCSVMANNPEAQVALSRVIKLLAAFAIATKGHLRQATNSSEELTPLLTVGDLTRLEQSPNPPLEISLWIGDYLQEQYRQQHLDANQRVALGQLLNQLIAGLTCCERIATTPVPIAYNIYLKRLTLIYCGFLPFSLVERTELWTGLVVAIVSFVLTGVEEIGNQIENPFGTDPNDLPLDRICQTILDSIETTLAAPPGGHD